MSAGVLSPTVASRSGSATAFCGTTTPGDVVEIGLLLPAEWAAPLMELAKDARKVLVNCCAPSSAGHWWKKVRLCK